MRIALFTWLLLPAIACAQPTRPPTILLPPVKPSIPLELSEIPTVTVIGTDNARIDTPAIQRAINSVMYTPGDSRQGCVILKGRFGINKPLQCGIKGTRSVSLHGDGDAVLSWRGPKISDYMIRVEGGGRTRLPVLKNLRLYCWWKCRGILQVHQAYRRCMESVYIYKTAEVGVDLVDCWGSSVRDVHWIRVGGVALRTRGGAMHFEDCGFAGYGSRHVDGAVFTEQLQRYQQINGIAATKKKYGDKFAEYWPDPDDESVKRYNGAPVQTKVDARCMLDVSSGVCRWESIIIEGVFYAGYPVVVTSMSRDTWQDIFCELVFAKCIWRIDGFSKHSASQWGLIDNVSLATGKNPVAAGNQLEYLVIANKAHTAGLKIRRIGGGCIRNGILLLDGGEHWNPIVEQVSVWYAGENPGWRSEFPRRQWIVNRGATVHDTVPVGRPVAETVK